MRNTLVSFAIALVLVVPLFAGLPVSVGGYGGGILELVEGHVVWQFAFDYQNEIITAFYEDLSGHEGWTLYWTDHTDVKPIYRGNPADSNTYLYAPAPNFLTAGAWIMESLYPDPGGWLSNGQVTIFMENATGYGAYSWAHTDGSPTFYLPNIRLQKMPVPVATTNGTNIYLTWPAFHQFDDLGNPLPAIDAQLEGYLVYRSTTNATWNDNPAMGPVSGNPSDWALVGGTVNSPVAGTSWTDTGILTGSGNTYHYSVKPVVYGFTNNVDFKYGGWGSNGIFDNLKITLQQGWNLISIPLIQPDESVDKVLESLDGKWDIIQTYNATGYGKWLTNLTYRPDHLNEFNEINHKMGLWINITELGADLAVNGLLPGSTDIPLLGGWNLVGYPSMTTETVTNAFLGTGADAFMVGDTSEPYNLKEVGPTYLMEPGEGYWVHVPFDTVWTVDW